MIKLGQFFIVTVFFWMLFPRLVAAEDLPLPPSIPGEESVVEAPPPPAPPQVESTPAPKSSDADALLKPVKKKPVHIRLGRQPTQSRHKLKPKTPVKKKALKESAFVDMSSTLLPLSTDQINRLHALFNETQRASAQSPGVPPLPTSSSLLIDLAPGTVPPIIRLGTGYVSSVVFLDASGAPWPIQAYDIGNPTAYNVQWDKKSNILMIQSENLFKRANMIVLLKGLNTPISLTLVSGQKAIDYRVDLRVPGLGPNAKVTYASMPTSASSSLIKILDGIPPAGSRTLKVEGGEASAWLVGDYVLLRTRMTVLSPAWIATMAGPDSSVHAYQLPKAAIVLATMNGRMVQLRIKGF